MTFVRRLTTTNYNMLFAHKKRKIFRAWANAHPKWLKSVIGPWYKEPCITQ